MADRNVRDISSGKPILESGGEWLRPGYTPSPSEQASGRSRLEASRSRVEGTGKDASFVPGYMRLIADRSGHPGRRPFHTLQAHELQGLHALDAINALTGVHDKADMQASKRAENYQRPRAGGHFTGEPSLLESVRQHGVSKPVHLGSWGPTIVGNNLDLMNGHALAVANGNHRVMASYDTDPNQEVPVINHHQMGSYFAHPDVQGQTAQYHQGGD